MAKQVFAIVLDSPNAGVAKEIQDKYPGAYKHSTDVLYLVTSEAGVLTRTVADDIGLRSGTGATGAVFKLNAAYSGFTNPALWEWLGNARDD